MSFFEIDPQLESVANAALEQIKGTFADIDRVTEYNQQKVLSAFIHNKVSESHFSGTTGYGYGDRGREVMEQVFAEAMGAEDALVRHSILCGTHAITVALFGILRPGDLLLAVTGTPYDTLLGVIGVGKESPGSLAEYGVRYREVALGEDGFPDLEAIRQALKEESTVKAVHIQRSRGYNLRPSLSVEKIGETELVVAYAKEHHSIALFIFTKQPEGYVLMEETVNYGIPENGGSVTLSFDAPWEGKVDYEVTAAGFDHEPTVEELKENGLGLCHEDEGFYFAVKVDRYEFLRTLTTTVDY
jgi:cystathionine beta-lyase family protein involved in aluminum resistance